MKCRWWRSEPITEPFGRVDFFFGLLLHRVQPLPSSGHVMDGCKSIPVLFPIDLVRFALALPRFADTNQQPSLQQPANYACPMARTKRGGINPVGWTNAAQQHGLFQLHFDGRTQLWGMCEPAHVAGYPRPPVQ